MNPDDTITRDDTIHLARLAWEYPGHFDTNAHNILAYEAADEAEQDRAVGALVRGGLREKWERDLLHRLTGVRVPGPTHRPEAYRWVRRNLVRALLRTGGLDDAGIDALIAEWSGRDLDAVTRERGRDKN